MEEKIFGEQPEQIETLKEDNSQGSPQDEKENVELLGEAERGVPVRKFKSVEDLEKAYNSLQSEFTRKCQKLAEYEKDKSSEKPSQNKFDEDFQTFLSQNQHAYAYADEIRQKVENDALLKGDDKAFEKVWANMVFEKISAPNKADEPLVQNLILQDENLKNMVIQNYMKQLQENKTPFVMSSGSGERVTKPVTPKPDSFEKAKQAVLDLLS